MRFALCSDGSALRLGQQYVSSLVPARRLCPRLSVAAPLALRGAAACCGALQDIFSPAHVTVTGARTISNCLTGDLCNANNNRTCV